MMFFVLLPLLYVGLVVGVLTIAMRERGRSSQSPPDLSARANHPLRQLQIALNAPRKQAQRDARHEAQRAAHEQEPKPGSKPERPPQSRPRWLKQV